jgi:hypothetical protein
MPYENGQHVKYQGLDFKVVFFRESDRKYILRDLREQFSMIEVPEGDVVPFSA